MADPSGTGNKFEQFNLGASIGLGKGRLFANVQSNRLEGGAKGTALAATYSYELSKRTNVYASYARLSNNATGRFGLNSSGTSVVPAATAPGAPATIRAGSPSTAQRDAGCSPASRGLLERPSTLRPRTPVSRSAHVLLGAN